MYIVKHWRERWRSVRAMRPPQYYLTASDQDAGPGDPLKVTTHRTLKSGAQLKQRHISLSLVSSHSVFVCLCVTALSHCTCDPYGARSRRLHLAAVWPGRAARWPARQRRGRNAQTRARAGRRPGARRTRTDNANRTHAPHGTQARAATQPRSHAPHTRTHAHTRAHTHIAVYICARHTQRRESQWPHFKAIT